MALRTDQRTLHSKQCSKNAGKSFECQARHEKVQPSEGGRGREEGKEEE